MDPKVLNIMSSILVMLKAVNSWTKSIASYVKNPYKAI
jgi:hypothetical protein